jgi:hypothetical protein
MIPLGPKRARDLFDSGVTSLDELVARYPQV